MIYEFTYFKPLRLKKKTVWEVDTMSLHSESIREACEAFNDNTKGYKEIYPFDQFPYLLRMEKEFSTDDLIFICEKALLGEVNVNDIRYIKERVS